MNVGRQAALRERIAALSESARNSLAHALAQESPSPGAARLAAYLVFESRGGSAPSSALPTGEQLRAYLTARLPAYMIPASFAALESLPRTPAGKLDRRALARETGTSLATTANAIVAPRTPIETTLAGIWRDVLRIDEVSVYDDFFELGGDSLLSIRVIARAGREGLRIPIEQFFENPTIAGLAALSAALTTGQQPGVEAAEQGVVTGEAPLTPIQHWFLDAISDHRDHWNQAYLIQLEDAVDNAALERVVRVLITHHDTLRLRLINRGGGWSQDFQPIPARVPLRTVDLSAYDSASYAARIAAECDREHASLRLAEGALFRCVSFEGAHGWRRLLLLAHHLIVDAVSWEVLFEDLATLLRLTRTESPLRLPAKTASARAWARGLGDMAGDPNVAESARHWLAVTSGTPTRVPVDMNERANGNRAGNAELCIAALDQAESSLLADAAARLESTTQTLLLAALLLAWRSWTGEGELLLDVEGHGRDTLGDSLDVSRTVGWFTTVFPVRLTLPGARATNPTPAPPDVVRAVHSTLSAIPHRGASHGLLRWLAPDDAIRSALGEPARREVLFNYLGVRSAAFPSDSPIRFAAEPHGITRSPEGPRAYVLEVNAYIDDGRLTLDIEYSNRLHRPSTIKRFGDAILAALRTIAKSPAPRFTLAPLDVSEMSLVADLLSEADDA